MPKGQSVAKAKQPSPQPETWNFSAPAERGKIVAFSGKMSSGKDSSCRFLYSLAMMSVLQVDGRPMAQHAEVSPEGKLMIDTGDGLNEFNEDSRNPEVRQFLAQYVWPFIRKFSCAAPLKEFLHNVLQVPELSLWGTASEKNEPTHLRWGDMPTFDLMCKSDKERKTKKDNFLTGRDIMEYFGSEIIRKMYPNAWAKALAKEIVDYNSAYSVVNDIRFFEEVDAIHEIGGKVIRLTLITEESAQNKHRSNVELDNYDRFDYVLDNQNKNMNDSFMELISVLSDWDWFSVVNS